MSRPIREKVLKKPLESPSNVGQMMAAWREKWVDVFKGKPFVDLLAGVTVAAVALPLNVGLAVACRLPPVAGLIAGALGGLVAALGGGAPLLVTGPAAALSFMVLDIQKSFGAPGVALAALLVGVLQLVLAFTGAGKVVARVPESVLAGVTTGVGVKLLDQQVPEFLGFPDVLDAAGNSTGKPIYQMADVALMMHQPKWLHHVSLFSVVCGLFVAFLVVTLAKYKRFPAAIVGIGFITFVSSYLHWDIERVGDIPKSLPSPSLPIVADEAFIELLAKAAPLGLLAAVESLLSARAIDRMVPGQKPHNASLELFGQGLANVAVGFFSGMPVTGVIARSSVNVQSGGKTRLASAFHAVLLLVSVLYLGRYIATVPIAALAGLLCVIGYRLVEVKTLVELARHERVEAVAFVATAAGTVSGHLITGMVAGLGLHFANRYMHRHEDAAKAQLGKERARGIRAVLKREHAEARKHGHAEAAPKHHAWLSNLFGMKSPKDHITGLFTCLLRNEIANFRLPVGQTLSTESTKFDFGTQAGSYALIRRERGLLNQHISQFCQEQIGNRYGVKFNAVDLTDILPPDELADALNAVIHAHTDAEARYFRAEGESQQRILAAERGVEIAKARARAIESEIRKLGEYLSELGTLGTLEAYVVRRRSEVLCESRTVYVKEVSS